MKRWLALAVAVAAVAATALVPRLTQAQAPAPAPTAGSKVGSGLVNPRGFKMGPDGMLYIAEAGNGGTTEFTAADGSKMLNGFSGRISKMDPATGERTTVADKLPSNASPPEGGDPGDSVGPADVAFIGDQLYYVQTHGGADWGFPDTPTGVYKVKSDGTTQLIADIGAFNKANPVTPIKNGTQQDIEPGGNPYSMIARGNSFYVSDGNMNQVMKVDLDGTITRIADFPTHIVTTGIAGGASGPLYVSTLGAFPFSPEDGRVYQVGVPTGALTELARGQQFLSAVAIGNSGQLYALQLIKFDEATETPVFGSGTIFKVNADGTMTPLVTGFTGATAMIIVNDTAYVADFGVFGDGTIWKVPGLSQLSALPVAPPPSPTAAAAPTATPRTGISGPDTGSGGIDGDASRTSPVALAVLGAAALMLTAGAAGLRMQRR
jgi:hypothetical protein